MRGAAGGNPGPGVPPVTEKKDGTITVAIKNQTVIAQFEVKLNQTAYENLVTPLEARARELKGWSDLASSKWTVHGLAAATQSFLNATGRFPQGALPRAVSFDRGIEWRPNQRLSWVVELLPYLGDDYKTWAVNRNAAWNERENQQLSMRMIPHLLGQRKDKLPVFVKYPGYPIPVAATHFVGISGVGHDSAEFKAGDPETAKKRGVFGYDRVTKKADITDGLESTIVLIQVPADHKAPWMLGGGATVRGVSEEIDALAPFVCTTWPGKAGSNAAMEGKKGTVAIMADGKVRFLPADLPADTFRAMCTIAGGEKIENLDTLCPVVEEEKEPELKVEEPGEKQPEEKPVEKPGPSDKPGLPQGWKEVNSVKLGYTVFLPAGAKEQSLSQKTPLGNVTISLNIVELPKKVGGGYGVLVSEVPEAVAAKGVDALLEASKKETEQMLKAKGAKLTKEEKITFAGQKAVEWTIEDGKDKDTTIMRVFVVKNRIYQVLAGWRTGAKPEKEVAAFFDSFKLMTGPGK
jgi:hypothetical protein